MSTLALVFALTLIFIA